DYRPDPPDLVRQGPGLLPHEQLLLPEDGTVSTGIDAVDPADLRLPRLARVAARRRVATTGKPPAAATAPDHGAGAARPAGDGRGRRADGARPRPVLRRLSRSGRTNGS